MVAETGNKPDGLGMSPIPPRDRSPKPDVNIFHIIPELQAVRLQEAERAMLGIGGQFSLRAAVEEMRRDGDASALGEIGYNRSTITRPGVRVPEWDYSVVLWTDLHRVTPKTGGTMARNWISPELFEQYQRESLTRFDKFDEKQVEMRVRVLVDKYRRQLNQYSGTDLSKNIEPTVIPMDTELSKEQMFQGKAARVVLKPDESILLQRVVHKDINIPGEMTYRDVDWETVMDISDRAEHMDQLLIGAAKRSEVSFYNREGKRII